MHVLSGEIDVVVSVDEYFVGKTCKPEVVSINDDIAECPKCASVMKTAKCNTASTVKVILDCDGDRAVTMFSNIINELIKDTKGATVAVKLLSVPKHTFSVANKNVVVSVRKM